MFAKVALLMVNVAMPVTDPEVAVIVDIPTATPVAIPEVALIVATAVLLEVHATDGSVAEVRIREVPSENVAVATKFCVAPAAMLEVAGVTAMVATVAEVTVNVAVPLTVPEVAVMTDVPTANEVARPLAVMVATLVVAEVQVTVVVRVLVVPSL
jgi:hypothetical protein